MADNHAIELTDIRQLESGADTRKRFARKKDHITIVDDDQLSVNASESVSIIANPAASARLPQAAAVYTMEGPTIRDVLFPPPMCERSNDFGKNYFDVCTLTVPSRLGTNETLNYAVPTSTSIGNSTGGPMHLDSPDDDSDQQQNEDQNDRRQTKKTIISIIIVAAIAATWTGSTQFAKSSLTSANFKAPYFLVWFNTNWMGVCFPFYMFLMALVLGCFKNKSAHAKSPYRIICDASLIFGPSGITLKAIFTRSLPFTALWIVANYSYSQALAHISAGETTALFSSNLAFVYLLSWIFLHDAFVALRILAMLLAIIGIVLMVHAYGINSISFVGVVCAVVAAAVSAIYKVLFKKVVGDASFGQVSLFMSMLGLCNLLLSWPITLTLILTQAETIRWDDVPWPYICGAAVLSLLFNLFVNVGIAYTHPMYISIGLFLGLPLNAAVDAIWRKTSLNTLQITGGVCILISFLLLMLPENFASILLRWLGITRHHRDVYIITRAETAKRGQSS